MLERLRERLERALQALWFPTGDTIALRTLRGLLAPLAGLTGRIAAARHARRRRLGPGDRPAVVVIGNLVVGGTGKTPACIAIAQALTARGWRVGLLSGGYRAERTTARIVGPDADPNRDGDEPVMLARETGLPVAAGRLRGEALALLMQTRPDLEVVLSDDGLQHPGLPRSLEVAVFDRRGIGNGGLLPAGPMREPLALASTLDALLLNGTDLRPVDGPPAFRFDIAPEGFRSLVDGGRVDCAQLAAALAGSRVAALAGTGSPARFFQTLEGLGLRFTPHPLPDHAVIDRATLAGIRTDHILMTTKDAVKCAAIADARCWALEVRACIPSAFIDWLEERLRGRPTA
jgi:tetraacyldisaccharide 4'-kinase